MAKSLSSAQIKALVERKALIDALRAKFTPHAKQKKVLEAYKAGKTGVFARCGRQSGKTMEACDIAWLQAGTFPNSVVSIITPERKQGYKVYWKKRTIQNFGPKDWIKKVDNEHMTIYFHNGSYIEIDGSDNIDSHRGDTKNFVILDEFKDIHPEFFEEVVEPMLLTTNGKVLIIGTPPKTPESHYREREIASLNDPDWEVVHWTSYDSPYTNKTKLEVKKASLQAMGMLDTFKREYLAEYTHGGKDSVFQMFSRSTHMKAVSVVQRYFHQNKDRMELYWINDPGTSSVFASLFVAYWREKGQIILLDEIYERDKQKTHTGAIYEAAVTKIAPFEPDINKWQIGYDDAAVWFANELKAQCGLPAYPVKKASREKEEGISLIKAFMLAKNAFIMSESCENTAKELENYIMVNGQYPKINDHEIDNLRYLTTFANMVLALGDNEELIEEAEDYYDHHLERFYDDTGLPEYMQ